MKTIFYIVVVIPSSITVHPGDSARLLCLYTRFKEILMWTFNGGPLKDKVPLTVTDNYYSIDIHQVNAEDVGNYTCMAIDNSGPAFRGTGELRLLREILIYIT